MTLRTLPYLIAFVGFAVAGCKCASESTSSGKSEEQWPAELDIQTLAIHTSALCFATSWLGEDGPFGIVAEVDYENRRVLGYPKEVINEILEHGVSDPENYLEPAEIEVRKMATSELNTFHWVFLSRKTGKEIGVYKIRRIDKISDDAIEVHWNLDSRAWERGENTTAHLLKDHGRDEFCLAMSLSSDEETSMQSFSVEGFRWHPSEEYKREQGGAGQAPTRSESE
jgi:hypothetical protein